MGFKIRFFSNIKIGENEYSLSGNNLGGSDSVYKLKDLITDNQDYVIKIHTKPENSKRFNKEISFLKEANNKGIINLVEEGLIEYNDPNDCTLNNSYRFYVMPYMPMNYRHLMEEELDNEEKLKHFLQLCYAVEYLHENSIVHRDLKPENILFDKENNQIKLCDFGVAKFPDNNITERGERLANANYCAPEQRLKNGIVGKHSDIYALGLILNELFTKTVINGKNYKQVVDVAPSFGELDDIIGKMIVYDWKERESNISAVIYKINNFLKKRKRIIEGYVKNALAGSRRQRERKIAKIFAEDCLAMQYLINDKTRFNSADFNYHMNVHCEVNNQSVRDEIKLAAIYYSVKNKFLYESQGADIEGCFNHYQWTGRKNASKNKFLSIIKKYDYLKLNYYGEAIHYFAGLKDYHSEEIIGEIERELKKIDDDLNDSPIVYMCQFLVKYLPETRLYNLGFRLRPIFEKSSIEIQRENIFANTLEKKRYCKELLQKFFPKITIVEYESNMIVVFRTKSDFNQFVKYCNNYSNSLSEKDIKRIDVEDMINDASLRNKKYEMRLYGYEMETLLPKILEMELKKTDK